MAKNLYISDLHFGHGNIIKHDKRPFMTVEEMEEALVYNWVKHVAPEDTVYILGDFCWRKEQEWIRILQRLNGKKVLIRGNHDMYQLSSKVRQEFVDVADYKEIDDNGRKIVLCHYPIVCFKNHFYGWYHLYGHVHNSFEANMMESDKKTMVYLYDKACNMFNVGCMMPWMDYTPRTLDEIILRNEKM